MTLGRLLNLSVLQFHHLLTGGNTKLLQGVVMKSKEVNIYESV